ncbi:MAG TPA: hypothetical protein VHN79_05250 [Lacunisphaera sp.]|nr:hypothetical protein [Lacunisphaera sp.]
MIYRSANARSLGFVRLLVFGALLLDLLTDRVSQLGFVPLQTFNPHGILHALPESWYPALLSEEGLRIFQWSYAAVLGLGLVGFGPHLLVGLLAAVGTIWFDGVARSFGGHVNHQELIMLHALFLIMLFPHFDAFSVNAWRNRRRPVQRPDVLYVVPLVSLCFFLAFTYYMVALARVTASDVAVYFTNTMPHFAAEYSLKWNYWELSWGRYAMEHPWFALLLQLGFPCATLLELVSPLAVFCRGFRRLWLPAMIVFHLSIWRLMNIFFWQHLLLLLLFAEPFGGPARSGAGARVLGGSERLRRALNRLVRTPSPLAPATATIVIEREPATAADWRQLLAQIAPHSDLGELLSTLPGRIGAHLARHVIRLAGLIPFRRATVAESVRSESGR